MRYNFFLESRRKLWIVRFGSLPTLHRLIHIFTFYEFRLSDVEKDVWSNNIVISFRQYLGDLL